MLTKKKTLSVGMILATGYYYGLNSPSIAESFSYTKVTSLIPLRPAISDPQICLNFEATFSQPLQKEPSALLDVERMNSIEGVKSFQLKVTRRSPKSYDLSVVETDSSKCSLLRSGGDNMAISIEGARGMDGLPILPDQRNIRVGKIFGQ